MNMWPDYGATTTQKTVVMLWRRFCAQDGIPYSVRNAEFTPYLDYITERLVLRATGYVLGEHLPPHTETATATTTFEKPATWWQHVKLQHGHRWWLRAVARWRPPRMLSEQRTVTLTATWEHMATYPWAELTPLPEGFRMGEPVRLSWLESSLLWEPIGEEDDL